MAKRDYHHQALAESYVNGTMTDAEAWEMFNHCAEHLGYHCLDGIEEKTVLRRGIEELSWCDNPEYRELVASACAKVSRDWESEERSIAEDLAIEHVEAALVS